MIESIVDNILQGFDFSYCVTVNVLTYIIIVTIASIKDVVLTKWQKRIVLVLCILIISTIYYFIHTDIKVLVNSSILAPVSWSWVFKPICKRFNIDYKHEKTIKPNKHTRRE